MWLIDSSIGRKLIMSITGLFLILFLIFHMSMNVVAIFSGESYNKICEFLGANWYALVGTAVLAGGFVLHIIFATILTLRNQKARGEQSYAFQENQPKVEWASRNMFVLGIIVLLGLCMHLSHFWAKMQLPEIMGAEAEYAGQFADGAALIKATFANPIICLLYIVWFIAIWFHLTHGFWSAFQTMGLNGKTWFPRLKCIANIVSTLIFLGFAAVVVAGYLQNL
ncbi:MAG: succinate dehydrogenase/fumarate reductase cytochrome b subunit [Paludibacteraceae bacterium]|jgi:succinate dehydrogenase (or fumarate reductase) cytochrome b subunit, b558 family|nr:succinate dehydrogenase/fumarate reductase cytochrome b subunit [Paludibacteraceae bacterium]MCR5497345.1 succinate dehydrogenase/fumarate reductase cytochrome b subunit [Paludibacteraceae bacterium]